MQSSRVWYEGSRIDAWVSRCAPGAQFLTQRELPLIRRWRCAPLNTFGSSASSLLTVLTSMPSPDTPSKSGTTLFASNKRQLREHGIERKRW
jgi:hypothetical protein